MPDATRPGPSTLRSPFVARLVAHAMLDALMQRMHLLDERLEQMRITLMHCQSPVADPGQGSLPFDHPSA